MKEFIFNFRQRLYFRKCDMTCNSDTLYHSHHLTWLGARHYIKDKRIRKLNLRK